MIFIWLIIFIIAIMVYAFARAAMQATIFNYRDGINLPAYLNSTGEIHFVGWLEPLSLITAAFANAKISLSIYVQIAHWIIAYMLYLYTYSVFFNYNRHRDWFVKDQKYSISFFGVNIEIKMFSETTMKIMYVLAYLLILGIYIIQFDKGI